MRIMIISGGKIEDDFAMDFYRSFSPDYVIGADRGLEFLFRHKLPADYILGDFDSVSEEAFLYYSKTDIPLERFKSEKDETDTELAVDKAMELLQTEDIKNQKDLPRREHQVCILGATGSRLDHVLGNLHLLVEPLSKGISVQLVDEHNRIRLLVPGTYYLCKQEISEKSCLTRQEILEDCQYTRLEIWGDYVSLIPFSDVVSGLTLNGFKYPLTDFTLNKYKVKGLGISNELSEAQATFSFQKGLLIFMESRD